jgi:hypothetical protein
MTFGDCHAVRAGERAGCHVSVTGTPSGAVLNGNLAGPSGGIARCSPVS